MKYSYVILIAVAFVSFLLMRKSANDVVQNVASISEQVSALPYEKENSKTPEILPPPVAPKPVNKNLVAVFKGNGMCTVLDIKKDVPVGSGHYNSFSTEGHGPCVLSTATASGVTVQTVGIVLSLDPLTKTISSTSTSATAVARLQIVLAGEGYLKAEEVSGNYLGKTVGAVKQFQSAHHLEVTGSAGPQTREVINALLASKGANPLNCPGACGYIQ
jgi:hypothetical protein